MKKVIIIFLLILLFSVPVKADDLYKETVENSNISEINEFLPDEIKEFFKKENIDITDADWNKHLTAKNVFLHIFSFFRSGGKVPFRCLAVLLSIIILSGAVEAFSGSDKGVSEPLGFIFSVIVCLSIADGVISVINASVSAIKGTGTFMLSFVPIYSGIILLSGSPTAATVSGGMLILAAEIIVQAAAFVIVPLMCAYFALGLASGVSPLIKDNSIVTAVKNIALWVLALTFTAFAGLLSLQTTLNTAADTVGVKTAKFFVASFVPVAGPALSEALTTVSASMQLLKSSVGLYAVIAVILILLPLIIELFLWRIVIIITGSVSNMLSIKLTGVLKAMDSLISVLMGMILFVGALFTISISVLIKK